MVNKDGINRLPAMPDPRLNKTRGWYDIEIIAGYIPDSKMPMTMIDPRMTTEKKLKEEKLAIWMLKRMETGERTICIMVTARARAITLMTSASVKNCPIMSAGPAPETLRVAISLNLR